MFRRSKSNKKGNSPFKFLFALIIGMVLAVGASVWATTIGTNVTVTGNLTTSGTTASSSVSYALGVATTTPTTALSIVGSTYTTLGLGAGISTTTTGALEITGSAYFAGDLSVADDATIASGLGVGIATSTTGNFEITGSALFGDAAGDLVMLNAANVIYNNAGTTTIPAANKNSWIIATSSANIPFVRYDTSNYRVGVGTSTPGATFSVAGNAYVQGNLSVGTNGTNVATIQHAWINCGPATGAYTLAATTTGILLCNGNIPQGHAANDKVWLTASSTAFTANLNNWYIYTGKASSTAAGTIQVEIMNTSGATLTNANLGSTSWQLLLIK